MQIMCQMAEIYCTRIKGENGDRASNYIKHLEKTVIFVMASCEKREAWGRTDRSAPPE